MSNMTLTAQPAPPQGGHLDADHAEHIVGYGTFIKVWILLVGLTLALVGLSALHSPNLAVIGLLIITPTKASLVLFYFMHLKYESTALKYMVTVAILALVIFVGLTFSDYLFR
jgi:cytochrome c oxidase subunit IV